MRTTRTKPEQFRRAFGSAVRDLRIKRGISQEQLAELADIHRTYVSSIELGKVGIGLDIGYRLAGALSVRFSDLVRASENG